MKPSLKTLVCSIIATSAIFSAFSFGKKDVTTKDVEKMDSWQETFDISEKKEGKYNIYVEAKDKGGNSEIAGPYNLYIDPDSDYALSGVTNPVQNMRVPGNLNIVGTCVDDDGVSEVWLVLDGGEPVKAEGKEFWSYYLDTNNLGEGPHTIEVWGVDINGLSSQEKPKKKAFVTWNLDRRKPITAVTNYALGELVSGKINLKGTISDGNGIKKLYYSLDNGQTYIETKVEEDKNSPAATFNLAIDTRKSKDGPAILWFKAIDKMGSIGISSFLYFIDNTSPDVKIVSPAEDEISNGVFTVAGFAKDKVGIHSLSWSFNGQSGNFELVPGNPYWAKEIDTKGIYEKSCEFFITAVDTAGNIVTVKKEIKLNQEADKPVVSIQAPADKSVIEGVPGTLFLRGSAMDDDGVASIEYSFDESAPQKIDSHGVFSVELPFSEVLPIGEHKITVTATDIHGVKGNPVTTSFSSMGTKPLFSRAKLNGELFVDGSLVHPESNPVYEISISSESGIASYSYKVESGEDDVALSQDFTSKEHEKSVSLKIPLDKVPWGLARICISATDIYGRTSEKKSFADLKDLSYIHEDLLDRPLSEKLVEESVEEDLSIKVVSINGAEFSQGMNIFLPHGSEQPGVVVVNVETSEKSASVNYTIEGDSEIGGETTQSGKAEFVNGHFEIKLVNLPVRPTTMTIKATAGKLPYGMKKISFCVLRPMPAKKSSWKEDEVHFIPLSNAVWSEELKSYIVEAGSLLTAYANFAGASGFSSSSPDFEVSSKGKAVFLKAVKDGVYKNLTVSAKNAAGKTVTSKPINVVVDSFEPELTVLSPENHLWVQTKTQLTAQAKDTNGLKKLEYSLDSGATWKEMSLSQGTYSANLSFDGQEDGLVGIEVRATDLVGKTTTKSVSVQKDTTPPEVVTILPGHEDIVNGDNLIAFLAKDNGLLSKVFYQSPAKRGEKPSTVEVPIASMIVTHVGTADKPIDDLMSFKFQDAIGNETEVKLWDFVIDNKSDLPIAEVHVPVEDAVITRDFEFSGVIYDDDGVKKDETGKIIAGPKIFYKIDSGKFEELDQIGTNFVIPKKLTDFTDNEHSITVYAVDINGVKGPEFSRNFKVSLEEPKGEVQTPPISETVKTVVKMSGIATDKNGIKAVYISVDNGNSYNEAKGNFGHDQTECKWTYEFDTRVVEDGTHVVFMKVVDWYGIEGLYSSLINIDNTAPSIELMLPLDDSKSTGMVFFSGQTMDNIDLIKLYITIRSLDGKVVSSKLAKTDLTPDEIITHSLDLSNLDDGFYNVELTGVDAAQNITRVSRNIQLNKKAPKAKVELLYPLNGEFTRGTFNIYGMATSEVNIDSLTLFVDDKSVGETQLTTSGYFKFTLNQTLITDGQHTIKVEANLADASKIVSAAQYLNYSSVGPWVSIDEFNYGDFAYDRPYMVGSSGYAYDEDELLRAKAKGASKELREAVAEKVIEKVEISLDNGKTFKKVSDSEKWRYRIENEDIAEGYHFLLVRATMKNGETAVTRCIVQVDGTKPTIKLISPGSGGHYNQKLEFAGLAKDNVALKSVTLALRSGDKAAYEIPGFIQGLYFDVQAWGATLFSMGAGLTFFDDNVKLQVQWGQFTQEQRNMFSQTNLRYGGSSIIGMKLLANVYYLPFRYYLGPDWEWLSLNVALGANFTRFDESGAGKPQILSAGLFQLEFPRVTLPKRKMFRTISLYTEGQMWFIPSDVSSDEVNTVVPQVSVGLRVNVF